MIASLTAVLLYVLALVASVQSELFLPDQQQRPLLAQNKRHFNSSRFDKIVDNFVKERSITGLSIALTYDDRLVYASSFGYADAEAELKVTPYNRFRLASVSKSITAIAIMRLVEDGSLSLSDRVLGEDSILGHRYSQKTFDKWERSITVQHLLEHSLGFVDEDMCGTGCDPTYMEKYLTLDQWQLVTALLDGYTPSHAPGTFPSYSNFGYFLAGRVVEAASGVVPYAEYVKECILKPMGILNMTLAVDERQKHEVKYYDFKEPNRPYSFHVHRRDSVGAWIGTPVDLVKMLTTVNGIPGRGDFLNQTTISTMFTKSKITKSSYAKGFNVSYDGEGLIDAYKDGGYWGTRSFVNINFRNKTTYAIVVNSEMPRNEKFNGGRDLKTLMDNLTWPIEKWPGYDLFHNYQ
ncbi:uncharacterized protein PV09_07699 [Verruconis gallopava]|uniref:Beta-lactamase-related domain-containing protein n=1 Tax=Verruconis gallopava TaxID=253628 RepID=A0A0D2ANJ4_9PEZI|nr:uncharacterized protein PV09_07699 [Verruconis gallopava]KIW00714.1 hypothetical protein PV09_07699 [Verruconis gallopava]